jgi:hypothetical protein
MARDETNRVFEEFNNTINMSPGELDAWEKSDNYAVYEDEKSGGQPIDEPREDVERLLETPKAQWEDTDDGFNEKAEAEEALGFIGRMSAGEQGEPMDNTDPELSKRDASLLNWGFDPNPDQSDFVGDRQR